MKNAQFHWEFLVKKQKLIKWHCLNDAIFMASYMQLDQYETILRFKRPIMSSDTVKLIKQFFWDQQKMFIVTVKIIVLYVI